jgi:hypothetical protein
MVIRLTVTYACETWTLKEVIKHGLLVFERKILRKIFGPSRNYDGTWRELDNPIKGRNIVNFTKAQRISWLGHISRMEAGRTVKRIYEWLPHAIRNRGRPKIRWKDDVREDLKVLGIYSWTTRTQNISTWKEIIEQAKAFKK